MELLLLMFMAAAGLSAASSQGSPQFHFIYERKTFSEAQEYCREKYTDLVTVSNMDHINALNQMVDINQVISSGSYNGVAWIGLYDDVNSWRWSMSNKLFYRTGEDEFRNWKSGEPDNTRGKELCVFMRYAGPWSDELWHDDNCESLRSAVCFTVKGHDVTFELISAKRKWTEAQSYCRNHHTDLASVRNDQDNQRVKELLPALGGVWIGLFRDGWKWSDGRSVSFTYWYEGEPNRGNENCGAADFNNMGRWADWPCDHKFPFVCYSHPDADEDDADDGDDLFCED